MKYLKIITLGGILFFSYKVYIFNKQVETYLEFSSLREECLEQAVLNLHYELPEVNQQRLKRGNSVHVYLNHLDKCYKLARYRCWILKPEEIVKNKATCVFGESWRTDGK